MRIGSLFSGIGGLELGLEWAGVGETVWQVEQDPYCLAVLAKHWPEAQRFTDVRDVGAHNLPPVDVICGGFPCQDISYAGKGAGLSGSRSGLWYEYARIVREMGPRYVVVENVAALLTRGLDAVLGTLADCGYDAEWSRIAAADVGAPHLRNRIFLLAHANGERELQPQGSVTDIRGWLANGSHSQALAHSERLGREGRIQQHRRETAKLVDSQRRDRFGYHYGPSWELEPDVGHLADGIAPGVVESPIRALGNAVVPQVAEVVGRRLMQIDAERMSAAM